MSNILEDAYSFSFISFTIVLSFTTLCELLYTSWHKWHTWRRKRVCLMPTSENKGGMWNVPQRTTHLHTCHSRVLTVIGPWRCTSYLATLRISSNLFAGRHIRPHDNVDDFIKVRLAYLFVITYVWPRPVCITQRILAMMTSSTGNIFCVTGTLNKEFTGHRWIPLTKASDAELWCFLWSALEQTTPVVWDAIALIMTSL